MSDTDFAFDNPNIGDDWQHNFISLKRRPYPISVPTGVVGRIEDIGGVNIMAEYRRGKEMACADIVICTTHQGTPKVLLSKRNGSEPFGNCWWIYGGSVGAYVDLVEFIGKRAERECGVPVSPQVLLGFYRTSAEDAPQSTTQPCFASVVREDVLEEKMRTDPNHESVRLLSISELSHLPDLEQHWYPMHVARLALEHMPGK